jgi:hypothetical protein
LYALQVFNMAIDAGRRLDAVRRASFVAFGLHAILTGTASADTRAATSITNVATLTASGADGDRTVRSNPVVLVVAERLDVALARPDDSRIDVTPDGVAVPLLLTNRGNGREAFDVTALPSDDTAKVRLIAIDRDGNGRFDPAIDPVLAAGRTAEMEPGEVLRLLVVVDPAGTPVTASALTATARAATGSGPEGTMFASRGDAGSDAITGASSARADIAVPIGADAGPAAPTLFKSQRVRAPDGSANPVSGAVVTYRLEARFPAASTAVRIDDPVPQGTVYVPGSLILDTVRLSDADDGDGGRADDAGISVVLGDIAAAGTRTVAFQVTIQ